MKKAMFISGLMVLVVAIGFAAGGQEGEAGTDEPVRLRATHWQAQQANIDAFEMAAEEFNRRFDNATAEFEHIAYQAYWQRMPAMAAAGELPDILQNTTINKYALGPSGALEDLLPWIESDSEMSDKWDQFTEGVKNAVRYEDQVIMLPYGFASSVLLYNRDMFDEAGIDYPDADYTWEQLLEDAQALTLRDENDVVTQWGFSTGFGMHVHHAGGLPNWILQAGGEFINEDGTEVNYTSDAAVEATTFINDLINTHGVMPSPTEAEGLGDVFEAGRAAMILSGSWKLPQYKAAASFDWDLSPLPHYRERAQIGDVGGAAFSLAANAADMELGWEFLKVVSEYLGRHQAQAGGEMPTDPDLVDEWIDSPGPPYSRQTFANYTNEYGVPRMITPAYLQTRRELDDGLVAIFTGQTELEQGLQEIERNINRILREANE